MEITGLNSIFTRDFLNTLNRRQQKMMPPNGPAPGTGGVTEKTFFRHKPEVNKKTVYTPDK